MRQAELEVQLLNTTSVEFAHWATHVKSHFGEQSHLPNLIRSVQEVMTSDCLQCCKQQWKQ